MNVVHVDLLGVSVERCVDVLVNEGQDVRLLHGNHVVGIERFGGIRAPELFVQRQKLDRRPDLLVGDGVEVLALGAFEGEPHRQSQEVAERQGSLIERLAERLREVRGKRGLRTLEALERLIELSAGSLVVVGKALSYAFERPRRDRSVRWNWSNGRTSDPHEYST